MKKLKVRLLVVMLDSQSIKGGSTVSWIHHRCGERKLELSRQRMRENVLGRFKFIKTCVLARELCLLVRTNRMAFNVKDAHNCCAYVATLCGEAGCKEPSDLCSKAAEAVLTSEEKYLEICGHSCLKCGESRRPVPTKRPKRNSYVA